MTRAAVKATKVEPELDRGPVNPETLVKGALYIVYSIRDKHIHVDLCSAEKSAALTRLKRLNPLIDSDYVSLRDVVLIARVPTSSDVAADAQYAVSAGKLWVTDYVSPTSYSFGSSAPYVFITLAAAQRAADQLRANGVSCTVAPSPKADA